MTTNVTGADLAYQALRTLEVEHVFGIVSVHNIPIYDAILRHGGITPIDMRHEQAAVHAADAYARATGKLGVAITSTGPGAANGVPGLYEAQFASSPVLMLTGQVDTPYLGKGKGFLHEAERQGDMLATVTRRTEQPRRAQDIGALILAVAHDLQSGRPQPGAIEIPIDLQYESVAKQSPEVPTLAPAAPADAIAEAAGVIGSASRRVIWCGGGVVSGDAAAELVGLAEALDAPVFTTTNGRGAISEDHPLAMGPLADSREFTSTMTNAEVVIAVGTRFQSGSTATWKVKLGGKLVHIDADPHMVGLNYPAEVAVIGDARAALQALRGSLNAEPGDLGFLAEAQTARDEARANIRERMGPDHQRIMDHMRANLPRQGIVVRDSTVPAYVWANRLLPILAPRTSINPTSAAIGPGLPFGIGAAVGTGEKTIVIQGDGGFMLHIGELATAAQYQLPVIVCLFQDGGYGVLRGIQQVRFDGRNTGVDIATPDFVAVAQAMGVSAERVRSADEFEAAFSRAIDADGPVLLEIEMNALAPMADLFGRPRS